MKVQRMCPSLQMCSSQSETLINEESLVFDGGHYKLEVSEVYGTWQQPLKQVSTSSFKICVCG